MLKIVTAPNPILAQKSKPVAKIDKSILNLIEEMGKTLLSAKDPEGVGLAAPQIDKSLQIFIAKPTPKSHINVFINPVINTEEKISYLTNDSDRVKTLNKPLKRKSETKLEGCLSLPNIWGEVRRNPSIVISYLDEKGKNHIKKFRGLFATIVQHEIDHLNGILFPKKVLEQKGQLYKSHKDEKNEDIFEEIVL